MQIFVKAMYDSWCHYQDENYIKEKYYIFIDIASESLHRDKFEMKKYLFSQEWFVRPLDISVLRK